MRRSSAPRIAACRSIDAGPLSAPSSRRRQHPPGRRGVFGVLSEGPRTLGGKLAALTGRSKLAELAIESLMVVFAVLVAFGVEEWREERQLRQFADVARAAVELELRENLDEFRKAEPALAEATELFQRVLQAESEDDPIFADGEISFSLPLAEISSAAWRAAQARQASPYRLRLGHPDLAGP